MAHSKVKIWVHGILGVKNRKKLIENNIENKIHNIIKKQFIDMGCYVEEINGTTDHVHVIFLLNPQRTVSDIFKQVKGAVSHEINSTNLIKEKFSWQVGYGGFSISESKVEEAKNYVLKQKQHHKKMTFKEEYDKFVELYGLKT
ncbi:MAG: IS200/IS605 family transposase [Bacteroidales bacterium]|nr:IS200/IS605 family transposase [Bacteroidales bacterium]